MICLAGITACHAAVLKAESRECFMGCGSTVPVALTSGTGRCQLLLWLPANHPARTHCRSCRNASKFPPTCPIHSFHRSMRDSFSNEVRSILRDFLVRGRGNVQAVQEFFLEYFTYFSLNFSSPETETVNRVRSHITSWKTVRSLFVEVLCLTIQCIGCDGETDKRDP